VFDIEFLPPYQADVDFKDWFNLQEKALFEMAKIPAPPGATHQTLVGQGYRYMQSTFGDKEWIYWRKGPGGSETISALEVPDSPISRQGQTAAQTQQAQTQRTQRGSHSSRGQQAQVKPWFLATAKQDEVLPDHTGVDHKIRQGQHVALKNNGDGTWAYATIWKGKLQWFNAHMPQAELAGRFQRVEENGKMVKGAKASDLAKATWTQKDKKEELTDEQRAIEARFGDIATNDSVDHLVINALAGTGKTFMLKYLAEKFGKKARGKNEWLYLVFGRENRKQAKKSFPKWVDVYTTHSYAGEVLDANGKKNRSTGENEGPVPSTQRFAKYSEKGTKAAEILDGGQYKNMLESVNVVHFDSPRCGKYTKSYMKKIWREFNREVEKIIGLAKAYNLDPDNPEKDIAELLGELDEPNYDINWELERVKEQLEEDPKADFKNEEISHAMGVDDFLRDCETGAFLPRMIKAAAWVLKVSKPHGIDQKWMQTHEEQDVGGGRKEWRRITDAQGRHTPVEHNLKGLRDFDDDLWYAARHAAELDWTKPQKYRFVLVDEVQDFNIAQKVLLQKLVEAGARIVAVGDPNQGMYRFRGADDNSFRDITTMLTSASATPGAAEQTLTRNFRSKPGIIDYSNRQGVVSNLQAGVADDPDDPAYISDSEFKYDDVMDRLGTEMRVMGEMKKETAIIARTNEPLAKAAMELLKHKIPFVIYGKDLARDVLATINRVIAWGGYKRVDDDSDIEDFLDELNDFCEAKKEDWGGKVRKQGQLKDLLEAQKALVASAEVLMDEKKGEDGDQTYASRVEITVKEFKNWLYRRLGGVPEDMSPAQERAHKKKMEEENPVILTTAHKSKGLEFERLIEITPSLYPHPRTKLEADHLTERRIGYVRDTRAKDEYIKIDDSEDD